jgi:NAD+ synthase
MYTFDALKVKEDIVQWIREWFEENGNGCNAIVGISGGKDSSVVAALCVEALGNNRVIGVLMPNGEQHDIDMAELLVKHLQIEHFKINIKAAYGALYHTLEQEIGTVSEQTRVNMPARLRMTTLYAVSQSRNGRVANTCNLSEDWVGYFTRGGDGVGDFGPLSKFTVTEVKQIGRTLGLPEVLVDKVPIDGLCGKTDEDNLGFTYAALDQYIRTGNCDDPKVKVRIDDLHEKNLFKLKEMPTFDYKG